LHHDQNSVTQLAQASFFLWIDKVKKANRPTKNFRKLLQCARQSEGEIVRSLLTKDWRPRLNCSHEFSGMSMAVEIVLQVEQERPPTLPKVVLNTNGKTLEEITNFPMDDPAPPDEAKPPPADNNAAPQRVRRLPETAWAGETAMNLMLMLMFSRQVWRDVPFEIPMHAQDEIVILRGGHPSRAKPLFWTPLQNSA
jgi:hypothetical protein